MPDLQGKVAVVTGASRGVGKGIATALAEAGAVVYVTGRTINEGKGAVPLAGTVLSTAEEIVANGGKAVAIPCDHKDDAQTVSVFERVMEEQGRLDILVNNVWGGYEHFNDGTEFWNEKGFWTTPLTRWNASFEAGVRAHYASSHHAAPIMIAQGSGLIVNVSALAAFKKRVEVAYGLAKLADIQMAAWMAEELREHGVSAVALLPGLVRTEAVMAHKDYFDMSNSESPQFTGKAVAALATDPNILEKSGGWFIAAELASEYGFTDIDGYQPTSIREEMFT